MTRLSVNINKIALIRNARGANFPDLLQVATDCEAYGAEGITVHPRPDERHIRYSDLPQLKSIVTTEFNIEGNPTDKFMDTMLDVLPDQCTLVPDDPGALTSDNGWDTIKHKHMLTETIKTLQDAGIRVSLFINPDNEMIAGAKACGADRIEFYTGPYAFNYGKDRAQAIQEYVAAAKFCNQIDIGINAGHDLNLHNLHYFVKNIPGLLEVSIGHALVVDALYYGLSNCIQMYLNEIHRKS